MKLVAIGGSDAGISAALRARELDHTAEVTVVVADSHPNSSICGIPYYISGEVTHWRNLAHRTHADLEATGMTLHLETVATDIDVAGQRLIVRSPDGSTDAIAYDELIVGTGAAPVEPPIDGVFRIGHRRACMGFVSAQVAGALPSMAVHGKPAGIIPRQPAGFSPSARTEGPRTPSELLVCLSPGS